MTSHAKDGWTDGDDPSNADDVDGSPADVDVSGDTGAPVDEAESSEASDEPVDDPVTEPVDPTGFGGLPPPPIGMTDDLADYEAELFGADVDLATERDEYRDALLRVKADFDNYRKRVAKDHAATVERAAEKIVADLLPVLDACEAALAHGAEDVEPIFKSLVDILEKGGLQRMQTDGQVFDPNLHEAVLHEPAEGSEGSETIVVESLRSGYLWNGRVVRPAMVKVKG